MPVASDPDTDEVLTLLADGSLGAHGEVVERVLARCLRAERLLIEIDGTKDPIARAGVYLRLRQHLAQAVEADA